MGQVGHCYNCGGRCKVCFITSIKYFRRCKVCLLNISVYIQSMLSVNFALTLTFYYDGYYSGVAKGETSVSSTRPSTPHSTARSCRGRWGSTTRTAATHVWGASRRASWKKSPRQRTRQSIKKKSLKEYIQCTSSGSEICERPET